MYVTEIRVYVFFVVAISVFLDAAQSASRSYEIFRASAYEFDTFQHFELIRL